MAERYQHIIVAPDSQLATPRGWIVPLGNQAPSLDMLHTMVSARQAEITCPASTECGWILRVLFAEL